MQADAFKLPDLAPGHAVADAVGGGLEAGGEGVAVSLDDPPGGVVPTGPFGMGLGVAHGPEDAVAHPGEFQSDMPLLLLRPEASQPET